MIIENVEVNEFLKANLKQSLNEKFQLFDVRTLDEWNANHLECAILLPIQNEFGLNENFINEFKAKFDETKRPVFICAKGHRSMIAASLVASELGIFGISLDGGMCGIK